MCKRQQQKKKIQRARVLCNFIIVIFKTAKSRLKRPKIRSMQQIGAKPGDDERSFLRSPSSELSRSRTVSIIMIYDPFKASILTLPPSYSGLLFILYFSANRIARSVTHEAWLPREADPNARAPSVAMTPTLAVSLQLSLIHI